MMRLGIAFLAGMTVSALLVHAVPGAHASPPAAGYARFAGTWFHHDGGISIDQKGHGIDHFRTFVNCTSSRLTACDRFSGNAIYAGGFTEFYLGHVNGNQARGTVTNSSFSWEVGTRVSLVLNANDTLSLNAVHGKTIGCGPHAPAGFCGALRIRR